MITKPTAILCNNLQEFKDILDHFTKLGFHWISPSVTSEYMTQIVQSYINNGRCYPVYIYLKMGEEFDWDIFEDKDYGFNKIKNEYGCEIIKGSNFSRTSKLKKILNESI